MPAGLSYFWNNAIIAQLRQELAPSPGRLAGTLRDTLAVIVAVVFAMTLQVEGISLALALLFLMQRERPSLSFRVGLQIFAGAAVACGTSLVWVQVTDGNDIARFFGIVCGVFIAAFLMSATRIPLFWTMFAFYWFIDLSAWDTSRSSATIVAFCLHTVAALAIVVLSTVVVTYLFATRHPSDELRQEIEKRILCLCCFFRVMAVGEPQPGTEQFRTIHNKVVQYAYAGDRYLNELYDRLRDKAAGSSNLPLGIHYRIGLLSRAMERSALLGFPLVHNIDAAHRDVYLALADLCESLSQPGAPVLQYDIPSNVPASLRDIFVELLQYAASISQKESQLPTPVTQTIQTRSQASKPIRLFLPEAFNTPVAVLYALKLTLAATICYVLYNAVAWRGILTCVVTVLFTGLSSTGSMRQKQLYRIAGAAVGGMLGIATVSLLYPNMDSITSLLVVVAAVSLLSGWILRSPRMSYVGVQVGFGFFLTALPGFSATSNIAPARDRVIGVALGILVMWFIFDQLWPSRTSDALRQCLVIINSATNQLRRIREHRVDASDEIDFNALRESVSSELATVQQLEFGVHFEGGRHRAGEIARTRYLIREIESSAGEFYLLAKDHSHASAHSRSP
jgi:multidrug resistance protein MdtO